MKSKRTEKAAYTIHFCNCKALQVSKVAQHGRWNGAEKDENIVNGDEQGEEKWEVAKVADGNHYDQREEMNNSMLNSKFPTTSNLSIHTENRNVDWHSIITFFDV